MFRSAQPLLSGQLYIVLGLEGRLSLLGRAFQGIALAILRCPGHVARGRNVQYVGHV